MASSKTEAQLNVLIEKLQQELDDANERANDAETRVETLENRIENDNLGWALPRTWEPKGVCVPRLEMYWERDDPEGHNRRCTYVMVYEHMLSIAKIAGQGDPTFVGIPLGQTKQSGSPQASFLQKDRTTGMQILATPFRDWAHALSDAKQLGLPLYISTCDGDLSIVIETPDGKNHTQKMLKVGGKAP